MPRPLHRWKSLWFGLLILAFILWAWIRSTTRDDELTLARGTTVFIVESKRGSLTFDRFSLPGNAITPWEFQSAPSGPATFSDYFPTSFYHIYAGDEGSTSLAWWLIALTFLLPWTTFLTWRHHHRIKRLATIHPV
ncbi:hypothetical protein [Luteolibacter soli]|uniref:DUF3592 domain-containing protein n=1 Tax=Luteolibacter soli TaxID=3135280 RepID=A0ABU9AW38_9BACT